MPTSVGVANCTTVRTIVAAARASHGNGASGPSPSTASDVVASDGAAPAGPPVVTAGRAAPTSRAESGDPAERRIRSGVGPSVDQLAEALPAHPAIFAVPRPVDDEGLAFHVVERHEA